MARRWSSRSRRRRRARRDQPQRSGHASARRTAKRPTAMVEPPPNGWTRCDRPGRAGVAAFAEGRVQRQVAQEGDRTAAPPRPSPRPDRTRAGHVLDQTQGRDADLFEQPVARRASIRAISCGVETITTPSSGVFWIRVSWMSPVPGGRSTTRMSSGSASVPQARLGQHLASGPGTPWGRARSSARPLVDQEADGHGLQAPGDVGLHLAVGEFGLAGDAQHGGRRRAVDVGVQQADPQAALRRRRRPG